MTDLQDVGRPAGVGRIPVGELQPEVVDHRQGAEAGRIAGAALDCTVEEPLPDASPLWGFDNVLITPHTAGETRHYEDNVLDILLENLERLWRGETELKNQVV